MKKSCILLIMSILFALPASLSAQTQVGGTLSASTTWNLAGSPYQVISDLDIPDMVTLTIAPGVEVVFDSMTGMTVAGTLLAQGTATDSIYFSGENGVLTQTVPISGRIWKGITLDNGALNFRYVHGSMAGSFLRAKPGTFFPNLSEIDVQYSTLTENLVGIEMAEGMRSSLLAHCDIIYNAEGVSLDSCVVQSCRFADNITGGIFTLCSINGNEFVNNSAYGAIINGSDLEFCDFVGNETAVRLEHYGLPLANQDSTWIFNNDIRDNVFGLWIRDVPFALVRSGNNVICNDSLNLAFDNVALIDVTNNCWCTRDSAELVNKTAWINTSAPFNPYIHWPIQEDCIPDEVYPGDANHDGVANAWDLLPIGVYFNYVGYPRLNASLNWVGQPARDWFQTQASGYDIKHVDCNGDSLITAQDTVAIQFNYGMTHRSRRGAGVGGIPLLLQAPAGIISPGDTVEYDILLGNMDTLANNFYGLAFSVNYDTAQIKPGGVRVTFDNSWLGTPGLDLLGLYHNDPLEGQVDIAMVRTNAMNRSGYGRIGGLIIVIDDDIAKKDIPLAMAIGPVTGIEKDEAPIDVSPRVEQLSVSTGIQNPALQQQLKVFPNPATAMLYVQMNQAEIQQVQLMDLMGRTVFTKALSHERETAIPVKDLLAGVYLLSVETSEGRVWKKVRVLP